MTITESDKPDESQLWKIKASEDFPGTIFVDFCPKGGPANLLGVYNDQMAGFKWPDGNMWTQK